MYTVVGYNINQINCDGNGAYGDTRSVKKDYVQEEGGKLIVNTVYNEGNQYVQHVRNGKSYDKRYEALSKGYSIERYYRRNKSFAGQRHMVVKVKNVDKMWCEDFFCLLTVTVNLPLMITDFCLMAIRQKRFILTLEHLKQF